MQSLAKMFKALSHPTRLEMFVEILEGSRSSYQDHTCFLANIVERLDIGAPTVSHHLKELVNADLIVTERQGKYVTCRVNPSAMAELGSFFART